MSPTLSQYTSYRPYPPYKHVFSKKKVTPHRHRQPHQKLSIRARNTNCQLAYASGNKTSVPLMLRYIFASSFVLKLPTAQKYKIFTACTSLTSIHQLMWTPASRTSVKDLILVFLFSFSPVITIFIHPKYLCHN